MLSLFTCTTVKMMHRVLCKFETKLYVPQFCPGCSVGNKLQFIIIPETAYFQIEFNDHFNTDITQRLCDNLMYELTLFCVFEGKLCIDGLLWWQLSLQALSTQEYVRHSAPCLSPSLRRSELLDRRRHLCSLCSQQQWLLVRTMCMSMILCIFCESGGRCNVMAGSCFLHGAAVLA